MLVVTSSFNYIGLTILDLERVFLLERLQKDLMLSTLSSFKSVNFSVSKQIAKMASNFWCGKFKITNREGAKVICVVLGKRVGIFLQMLLISGKSILNLVFFFFD